MVQQTSLFAYHTAVQTNINGKQQAVLNALKKLGQATDQELATALNWPINRITPRRGELVIKGQVKEVGKKLSSANRPAIVWEPVNQEA